MKFIELLLLLIEQGIVTSITVTKSTVIVRIKK